MDSLPWVDSAIYLSHVRPYESVRHPPLRIRSFRIESTEPAALGMFVFTHNTQRCHGAYPGLFSPTLHTLIGLQVHCTGFQPFAPWRTAGPSFAASRHGSGRLLRSATSRVSFSCGNLGLRSSTAASFYVPEGDCRAYAWRISSRYHR